MFLIQTNQEFIDNVLSAFRLNVNALTGVADPSRQGKLCGKSIYKRPEADALNSAANDNRDASETRHNALATQASHPCQTQFSPTLEAHAFPAAPVEYFDMPLRYQIQQL